MILISMFLLQFVSWIQIRDLVLFPMPRTTITTDIQTLVNGLYMVVVVVTGIDSMILVNARRNALKSRSQKIVRIILINVCFSCVFNHIFFSSYFFIFYWMQDIPRSKLTIYTVLEFKRFFKRLYTVVQIIQNSSTCHNVCVASVAVTSI